MIHQKLEEYKDTGDYRVVITTDNGRRIYTPICRTQQEALDIAEVIISNVNQKPIFIEKIPKCSNPKGHRWHPIIEPVGGKSGEHIDMCLNCGVQCHYDTSD